MKAVVIGASGATGRALVAALLRTESVGEVLVLVRRTVFEPHPKLREVLVDFDRMSEYTDYIRGDVAFSTLGTTLKLAGSKAAQWKVDVAYNREFARIARTNGVPDFVLLSALGADKRSSVYYSKMKGVLEDDVKRLNFDKLILVRPGLLIRPHTDRFGEVVFKVVLMGLNGIGLFRNYRPLPVQKVALAMLKSISTFDVKEQVLGVKEIVALSR